MTSVYSMCTFCTKIVAFSLTVLEIQYGMV